MLLNIKDSYMRWQQLANKTALFKFLLFSVLDPIVEQNLFLEISMHLNEVNDSNDKHEKQVFSLDKPTCSKENKVA